MYSPTTARDAKKKPTDVKKKPAVIKKASPAIKKEPLMKRLMMERQRKNSSSDGGDLMYSPAAANDVTVIASKKKPSYNKKDPPVTKQESLTTKPAAVGSTCSKVRASRLRGQDDADDDAIAQPSAPRRQEPLLFSPASTVGSKQSNPTRNKDPKQVGSPVASKSNDTNKVNEKVAYKAVLEKDSLQCAPASQSHVGVKSGVLAEKATVKRDATVPCSSLAMAVLDPSDVDHTEQRDGNEDLEQGDHFRPMAPRREEAQPGAFHGVDGPNARDVSVRVDDEWSISSHESNGQVVEVPGEVFDPEAENRIVQQHVDAAVNEKLAQQHEKKQGIEVAEAVTGFWCSRRVKIVGALAVFIVIVGMVLGTTLPRALEPGDPTTSPASAPTSVSSGLTELLSSESLDGGEALRTPSTPQNKALNWLINNTSIDDYSVERKIQRYSLATFFYSTGGENWKRNDYWLSDTDECAWFETICFDRAVTKLLLKLRSNNLTGTIPEEIVLLSNSLVGLSLTSNSFTGTIPTEIGLLTELESMQLWKNSLAGTIPPEIGSLTKLTSLGFSNNELTGTIPSEIGLLTELDDLHLNQNSLAGTIPPEIGSLTKLTSLGMSRNDLTGTIPSEIDLLTKLDLLTLYDNNLSGEFTCPTYIERCYISCNDFRTHDLNSTCRFL